MARQNLCFLKGYITWTRIHESGTVPYAEACLAVVRSDRKTGDGLTSPKWDTPIIMSRDPVMIHKMEAWQENDIVTVKGTVACKRVIKASYCTKCGERNRKQAQLVYINPIYTEVERHMESADEAYVYIMARREISNQVYSFGYLCTDPKQIILKNGIPMTQYEIALQRKYRIREDGPETRADFPWVRSYGENANSDFRFLHVGSEVFIDGCLQAREINRHSTCEFCGASYDWGDKVMELVPYDTEYVANFTTEEELEQAEKEKREANVARINRILRANGEKYGFKLPIEGDDD